MLHHPSSPLPFFAPSANKVCPAWAKLQLWKKKVESSPCERHCAKMPLCKNLLQCRTLKHSFGNDCPAHTLVNQSLLSQPIPLTIFQTKANCVHLPSYLQPYVGLEKFTSEHLSLQSAELTLASIHFVHSLCQGLILSHALHFSSLPLYPL